MSQTITITTKKQKRSNAIDKVEYQWHWNRIVLACLSVILILVCISWGLLSGVRANETTVVSIKSAQNEVAKVSTNEQPEKVKTIEPIQVLEKVKKQTAINVIEKQAIQVVQDNHEATSQEIEIKAIEPQKNTVIGSEKAIHSPTLISKSHLTKISHSGLIDIDFVTRAVLTTAVVNKEPIDVLSGLILQSGINEQLFFFTEVNNMQSKVVWHKWFFENTLMAEVELNIFSAKYRTYSSKKIMPSQSGNWRVELVTAKQKVLASKSFHIE